VIRLPDPGEPGKSRMPPWMKSEDKLRKKRRKRERVE
jgi:hypothetical protein